MKRLEPRRDGKGLVHDIWKNKTLWLMLIPSVLFMLVFVYYPFVSGIGLAFENSNLVTGKSEFVGMEHFKKLLDDRDFSLALRNTLIMGVANMVLGVVLPAGMALLLNELRLHALKRVCQVIIYLPSLFSWVVIGSIFQQMLSPTTGPVNLLIEWFGGEPIYFFAEPSIARVLFVALAQWKGVGYGLIIYLAAITAIDPTLYEAAELDGAGRWAKMWHVTLPGIKNTIKMMLMFSMIGLLGMFDQVVVLNNGLINDEVNVVMTYIYGRGIRQMRLNFAAAAALVVGIITLIITLSSKKALKFGFEGGEN